MVGECKAAIGQDDLLACLNRCIGLFNRSDYIRLHESLIDFDSLLYSQLFERLPSILTPNSLATTAEHQLLEQVKRL